MKTKGHEAKTSSISDVGIQLKIQLCAKWLKMKLPNFLGIFTHLDFVSVVTKQGLINEYRPWNVDKLGLCKFE